jgi:hypothetical protein
VRRKGKSKILQFVRKGKEMYRAVGSVVLMTVFGLFSGASEARYVKGRNWTDSVGHYTDRIQNYGVGGCAGGVLMEPTTTWWVLGPNDCDADGDMDAFTEDVNGELTIDNDYVAGWRGGGAANENQEIILGFDYGLEDIPDAPDFVIRLYCGGAARCSIWGSAGGSDINDFVRIGEVVGHYGEIPGTPGKLYDAYFDFNNLFSSDVHYLRVHRESVGSDTGMFFDSFGSAIVTEPNSCQQVAFFGWNIDSDINSDCYVNFSDYAILLSQWNECNDSTRVDCDLTGFPDANHPPSCCHGVWQSGFGLAADLNRDCQVDIVDIAELATDWLQCNNPEDLACKANW